jgi:hypothetical protein
MSTPLLLGINSSNKNALPPAFEIRGGIRH